VLQAKHHQQLSGATEHNHFDAKRSAIGGTLFVITTPDQS
jgi:hypothetical protein